MYILIILAVFGFAVSLALIVIQPSLPREYRSRIVAVVLIVLALLFLAAIILSVEAIPWNPTENAAPHQKTAANNEVNISERYMIALYVLSEAVSANCYGITDPPDLCTSIHSEIAYDTEAERLSAALYDFGEWTDNITAPLIGNEPSEALQRAYFRLWELFLERS